jgi:hypothetical protein
MGKAVRVAALALVAGIVMVAGCGVNNGGVSGEAESTTVSANEWTSVSAESRTDADGAWNVYTYEFGDLDGNGIAEYAEVKVSTSYADYMSVVSVYWNGENIYEHKEKPRESFDKAYYLDLDRDGENELVAICCPLGSDYSLQEYLVLKNYADGWKPLEVIYNDDENLYNAFPIKVTKGAGKWEAVIACDGLDKAITVDVQKHYEEMVEKQKTQSKDENWVDLVLASYENEFFNLNVGEECAGILESGIWKVSVGEYEGNPCLTATHEIAKSLYDPWGKADVYFNYDADGSIRILDVRFESEL